MVTDDAGRRRAGLCPARARSRRRVHRRFHGRESRDPCGVGHFRHGLCNSGAAALVRLHHGGDGWRPGSSARSPFVQSPGRLSGAILLNVAAYGVCVPLAQRYLHVRIPIVARRWFDIPLRAGLVALLVGVVVTLGDSAGPVLAGIFAVFPIVTLSMMLILHPRIGGAGHRRDHRQCDVGPRRLRARDPHACISLPCRSARRSRSWARWRCRSPRTARSALSAAPAMRRAPLRSILRLRQEARRRALPSPGAVTSRRARARRAPSSPPRRPDRTAVARERRARR